MSMQRCLKHPKRCFNCSKPDTTHDDNVSYHIKYVLRRRERKRYNFHGNSPQICYRPSLVSCLKKLAEDRNLSKSTLQLAVYLLDVFMDHHNISVEKLHLVLLVCFSIAVKMEENESIVPKLKELNELVRNKYKISDFIQLERMMCVFFDHNFIFPTISHFMNDLSLLIISEEDEKQFSGDLRVLRSEAFDHLNRYSDAVMKDLELFQKRPSLMAAAVFAATRASLGYDDRWPTALKTATGIIFEDFAHLLEKLLQKDILDEEGKSEE